MTLATIQPKSKRYAPAVDLLDLLKAIGLKHGYTHRDPFDWIIDSYCGEYERGGSEPFEIEAIIEEIEQGTCQLTNPSSMLHVLNDIVEELKDHPALKDGIVHFHIDW